MAYRRWIIQVETNKNLIPFELRKHMGQTGEIISSRLVDPYKEGRTSSAITPYLIFTIKMDTGEEFELSEYQFKRVREIHENTSPH